MTDYKIIKLDPDDYGKCNNIWNMAKNPDMTKKWYDEIVLGNRIVFIYIENGEFVGEGALVFENGDRDYTIPNQRIYLSRMIVKRDCQNRGVGGIILDYLIETAKQLGYKEISLGVDKVNIRARHLYEKKGFKIVIFDGADEFDDSSAMLKIVGFFGL